MGTTTRGHLMLGINLIDPRIGKKTSFSPQIPLWEVNFRNTSRANRLPWNLMWATNQSGELFKPS